jgi:hypothetical protein
MKKLLFATLVVSDLFAMNSSSVFDMARSENLTEQQVKKLHSAFDQCRKDKQTQYEMACEEYKKNPNSKEYSQINDKHNQLEVELTSYIHNELSVVSRDLDSEEEIAGEMLKKAFSLDSNTDIRIIDAESYINGLYLNRKAKYLLIKALHSDEELERQVDTFCENHRFVDMTSQLLNNRLVWEKEKLNACKEEFDDLRDNATLRSAVRSHMLNDSARSPVYRQAIVAYLAKKQALDFVSDHYLYPNRFKRKLIVNSKEACLIYPNEILRYDGGIYQANTLFKNQDSVFREKAPWSFILTPNLVFFHEAGHSLDFFSLVNYYMSMSQTEKIISLLLNIKADLNIFDKYRPFLYEKLKKSTESLEYLKYILGTKETDLNNILDLLRYNLTNPVFLAKFSLENSAELWQILGVFFNKYNGNNTLYINKMSDFALYCDLGLPIRSDHLGYLGLGKDSRRKEDPAKYLTKLLEYSLPLEQYGALMELHGISMQAYILKLMYPYGLISQLQTEYRLNSNLKEFKQIKK